ncbi:MAG: hypothetical protein LAO21_06770 [Acidobacteriia bacterium]|nr:hypothetical protein [Terriglobia bacterium]
MRKTPAVVSLALGIATSILVGLAGSYLPYSHARDSIVDAFATPGAWIAGLVYPQGVHTGRGAPNWGFAVLGLNFIVYILFWYCCLQVVAYFRRRRQQDDAPDLSVRRGGR